MSRPLMTAYCFLLTILLSACSSATLPAPSPSPTLAPPPTLTPEPTPTATPTEAPVTLLELGVQGKDAPRFQNVNRFIQREVMDGEKVLTTSATYWDGEQKVKTKYIIEQGTFDAHAEIYDDLTRPLTVKAYRLPKNYKTMHEDHLERELVEVTLLWQGPERGFREAIDLSGAYDPELNQVYKHPYLHIVHGNRPIQSIKDLPKDDERLTLLQSARYEQAKAIRALQDAREKLQNGEEITAEDLQGSIFLRPLQEKLEAGETITEDDLYVLFSPKAVEKWDAGGGLSLYFEFQKDGSKVVQLKAKGNDQPNQTYDSLNIKLTPLWFYTLDEEGNRHDMAIIAIMDADDVDRYKKGNPFGLQGKFVLAEELNSIDLTQEYQPFDFTQAYKTKKPLFPWIYVHAEGPILDKYPRLSHLLSLPDNKANQLEYVDGYVDLPVNIMAFINDPNKKIGDIAETVSFLQPIPPLLQLLELMFDVTISN